MERSDPKRTSQSPRDFERTWFAEISLRNFTSLDIRLIILSLDNMKVEKLDPAEKSFSMLMRLKMQKGLMD